MASLGEQIRGLRQARGMTLDGLAAAVGVTKGYLSMIENQRVPNPPSSALLASLERALGVADGRLCEQGDWERSPAGVREKVQRLAGDAALGRDLARYIREAAADRRDGGKNLDALFRSGELRRMVERALASDGEGGDSSGVGTGIGPGTAELCRVPLINKVAAGYPSGFTDMDYPARVADNYLGCPGLDDPDAFAATVLGESMMPEYREGDIVVFSPAAEVTDGSDCFVRLEPDHETTFKRVFFDEDGALVRLQPLNPKFPPTVYKREGVAGLYRAVLRYARL